MKPLDKAHLAAARQLLNGVFQLEGGRFVACDGVTQEPQGRAALGELCALTCTVLLVASRDVVGDAGIDDIASAKQQVDRPLRWSCRRWTGR